MVWIFEIIVAFSISSQSINGDTIVPQVYWALGPLHAGSREGWIDPTGKIKQFMFHEPDTTETFPTPLAQGGLAHWKRFKADKSGWVTVSYVDIMDTTNLMGQYGFVGLLFQAYVWTEVDVDEPGVYRLYARKTGTIWVNGHPYSSNPYGYSYEFVPVYLKNGKNIVLVKVAGFAERKFSIKFVRVSKPAGVINDYTIPDIVDTGSYWLGIPIVNQSVSWLSGLKVWGEKTTYYRVVESTLPDIPPLGVYKAPVRIDVSSVPETDTLRPNLFVGINGRPVDTVELSLPIVSEGRYRVTFISAIDSSVQYYAVLPPKKTGEPPYALIFSLHGAGVEAYGLVGAYAAKKWAYVVSPTNRRPFGFDWQDWGRLDALEVLNEVVKRFPIDTTRIYLTGHSMGGHGTWHIGSLYSWRFAAMEPGAGWESFQRYIPFATQPSQVMGDPSHLCIRDLVMAQNMPLKLLPNLSLIPILIVQGGKDNNVPPFQPRLLYQMVSKVNHNIKYWEVPGKPHWWSDGAPDSVGAACVDHPEIQEFFLSHTRKVLPDTVRFKTYNLSVSNRMYWVRVLRVSEPGLPAYITAIRDSNLIKVDVQNTSAIALYNMKNISRVVINDHWKSYSFRVHGADSLRFEKKRGGWRRGFLRNSSEKRPGRFGPIKEAYFKPFVIVYPTGDSTTTDEYLDLARFYQWTWYYRGNGIVQILPDTLVTAKILQTKNLILFGDMENNSVLKRYSSKLPISLKDGILKFGNKKYSKAYAKYVYPGPTNKDGLWQVNLGPPWMLHAFPVIYSGNGLPDFIVYTETANELGWGGILEAGFFDNNWRLKKR